MFPSPIVSRPGVLSSPAVLVPASSVLSGRFAAGVNADLLAAEIRRLLSLRLFRSASQLCNFLLPKQPPHLLPASAADHRAYLLMADSLNNSEMREYRRACRFYQLAIDAAQTADGQQASDAAEPDVLSPAAVRVRMADALLAVGDDDAALELLESLLLQSPSVLPAHQLSRLGLLLRLRRRPAEAVRVYQQLLQLCPYAIDAIISIISIAGEDVSASLPSSLASLQPSVHSFLTALLLSSNSGSNDHSAAIQRLSLLCLHHPLSAWLHVQYAAIQQQWFDDEVTVNTYQHAHELEPEMVDGMDSLALLSLAQSRRSKLCAKLQQDVLRIDDKRPEGWLIAGLAALISGQKEKSDGYIERALQLNESHLPAHLVRAACLLHADAFTAPAASPPAASLSPAAFTALLRTLELHLSLCPSLPAVHIVQPLTLLYLSLQQHRKALELLTPHIRRNRANPRLLTLLALTLTASQQRPTAAAPHPKAREALERAVAVDRYAFGAVQAYAALLAAEGKTAEAIALLRRSCDTGAGEGGGEGEGVGIWVEGVVCRLGALYAAQGDRAEALRFYLQTLRVNRKNPEALAAVTEMEEQSRQQQQQHTSPPSQQHSRQPR